MIVLCLRNGMNLLSITGNTQSTVIGVLLILSVLIPNVASDAQGFWNRRRLGAAKRVKGRRSRQERVELKITLNYQK